MGVGKNHQFFGFRLTPFLGLKTFKDGLSQNSVPHVFLLFQYVAYGGVSKHVSYRKPRAVSTEQRERARQMMIANNRAKKD